MALAIFALLGALTGVAIVIARQRAPRARVGVYMNTALLALALTVVVAVAAHLAASLLWVGEGEVGVPTLGPVLYACSGFFPAFFAGLVMSPFFVHTTTSEGHAALSLLAGLLLSSSVAVLAVVSAQAVMEMRTVLPRLAFWILLLGAQCLLLAAPALGFATVAWDLRAKCVRE